MKDHCGLCGWLREIVDTQIRHKKELNLCGECKSFETSPDRNTRARFEQEVEGFFSRGQKPAVPVPEQDKGTIRDPMYDVRPPEQPIKAKKVPKASFGPAEQLGRHVLTVYGKGVLVGFVLGAAMTLLFLKVILPLLPSLGVP